MNSLKTYHTQGTRKSINAILSDNKVLEKADDLPSSPTINIRLEMCSHAVINTTPKFPVGLCHVLFKLLGQA
jgi:hypothetical protein